MSESVGYDRDSDVLYISKNKVSAISREEAPGVFWRYSMEDGTIVGVTILDFSTQIDDEWGPNFSETAELASLRARLAEVEGERDRWRAAIRAADQLSIAAQTSGGVAGHDDGLVSAISHYACARAALEDQS